MVVNDGLDSSLADLRGFATDFAISSPNPARRVKPSFRRMSSLLQKNVGLPTLPLKASVRLDPLAFREPGHKTSEKWESCLLVKVQKQEDKLLELKQEQKDLRKQITGEFEALNREPIHGQSQRKRRHVLLEKLRVQLDETKRELLDKDNWGSTSKFATQVPIRNNLFRALLRLRRTDTPIALWVDVMCINQGDMNEKTDQLRRMVDIYRSAENVCIWLGEADSAGNSDLAMEFIQVSTSSAVTGQCPSRTKPTSRKIYNCRPLLSDSEFGEPEQVYGGRKNGDNLVGPFGQPRYKASGGK
ncbi:hypothetical protein J3459_011894 [Metarhizium acridum]|nr:hypothetical protein J3459_011894 [Metarhizium acridum]